METNWTDGAVAVIMVVVGAFATPPAVPGIAGGAVEAERPTDEPAVFPLVEEFLTLPPPDPQRIGVGVGAPIEVGTTFVVGVGEVADPPKFPGEIIVRLTDRRPPDIFF